VLGRRKAPIAYGRQNHHTQTCLHVCCERALEGAGEQIHAGGAFVGAGNRPRDSDSEGSGTATATSGFGGFGLWELGVIVWTSSGVLAAGGIPLLARCWLCCSAYGFAARSSLRSRRPCGP
jgi:hypothetical protein